MQALAVLPEFNELEELRAGLLPCLIPPLMDQLPAVSTGEAQARHQKCERSSWSAQTCAPAALVDLHFDTGVSGKFVLVDEPWQAHLFSIIVYYVLDCRNNSHGG